MNYKFCGYKILIESRLKKVIKKNLPKEYREIFDEKIKYLSNNPSHPSLNTKPYNVSNKILKNLGVDEVWEFYINRKGYRCIFYISHVDRIIIIAYVGNHCQVKNKFK
ncbi:MAG: hypothetical protein V1688_03625 [bacterium]